VEAILLEKNHVKLHCINTAFCSILSMGTTPNYGNSNSRLLYHKVTYYISAILEWYSIENSTFHYIWALNSSTGQQERCCLAMRFKSPKLLVSWMRKDDAGWRLNPNTRNVPC
jgi:hypothetical protein